MTQETFFEKFNLFADAPGAVAKMRELVLEIAIQGKLVAQANDDEPACKQLERIAAKKSKTGRVARVKPGKAGSAAPEETGTHVPDGWEKATLSELVTVLNGRAYSKDELLDAGTPVLRVGNLFTSKHWYYSDLELEPDKYCDKGDLIFAWSASFGPFIWPGPTVIYHYHIWKLELHSETDLHKGYLYWFLQNKTREIKRAGHGVSMLHMTKDKMEKLEVMLPPLAEQKRIVAKVDALMALCDRLEARQQERETRHAALARASLARFADAPTPANLPFLFHPSYAIPPADLRKSILTLAFAGKLVPQDPNDEPASVLLEKARAEKARLIERGIVKKEPWADKLQAARTLYNLPPGWEWTHVSDVVEKVTVGYVGSMKEQYCETGVPFLRCQNVRENRYEPIGLTFISEEFHHSITKSTLRPGDVVVTRSGNVGVTCVIPEGLPEANCSDLVIVKRPLALVPAFLSYFINSIAGGQIEAKTVGIALTHFNTQSVAQMTVALPPLAVRCHGFLDQI